MTATEPVVDGPGLAAELAAQVRGDVDFGPGGRALYATDASNYRQVPLGVVWPRDSDDVIAALAACRRRQAPVLVRGAGTAMAGQSTNAAVVLDASRHLHRVLEIDPERRVARVQPGCVLDRLRDAAGEHGLTFGPDPATHDHCTLGGMIGNDSCGVHSVIDGRTSHNVRRLDVLTYDGTRLTVGPTDEHELEAIIAEGGRRGEIYGALRDLRDRYAPAIRERYPDIPRRVAGYSLDALLPENGFDVARALVGSEGTCVTVLEAELRLVRQPPALALVVLGYKDVVAAGRAVGELLGEHPRGIEGFDHRLVDYARAEHLRMPGLSLLPDGEAWLMIELGGESEEEAEQAARELADCARGGDGGPSARVLADAAEQQQVWAVREAALGVTARLPDHTPTWTGWEDSAVAPERVGDYLADLLALYEHYGYRAAVYGHFGDGCIHNRLDFDLRTRKGIDRYRAFVSDAADLVVSYDGSISGEHGDGQSRAELLERMYGPELIGAFEQFKAIWDPADRMNPGKVVHPARLDEHLRLGPGWEPARPKTFFAFPDDDGSLHEATLRCVGVGKCRRESGAGVMCPSYLVTREERHSTRGRAHLLFEMLQGEVITDGWRSVEVRDALDLCLACKGCHSDCPVNVDMATYKAEFLSHHYEGRLRPAAHYSMGWLPLAARVAERVPRALNALTHAAGLDAVIKRAGGIDPAREIPRFADQSLRAWLGARAAPAGGTPVLLWPDTFTNYLHPHVGRAAVRVLEAAGFSVRIPERPLCCGLTWISTGQLGIARRVLARTVRALAPHAAAGTPIVGLEPSCTAVFRHDLGQLWPRSAAAEQVAGATVTLAELLRDREAWDPPRPGGRALVQTHCHQHAVLGFEADRQVLAAAGVEAEVLDAGCCGLAGNFGFERGHHEVSVACAERVLAPAIRGAAPDVDVLADGFSCRTQIDHTTGRRALHLAELLARGLDPPHQNDHHRPGRAP